MHIPTYIPQLIPSDHGQADRPSDRGLTASRGRQERARDSYQFNAAAATVIEAEYVDPPYSPPRVATTQNYSIPVQQQEPRQAAGQATSAADQRSSSLLERLQTAPADVPAPGSYLNLYA